jgi:hypothetical protein
LPYRDIPVHLGASRYGWRNTAYLPQSDSQSVRRNYLLLCELRSVIVITVDETDLGVANFVFTKSFVSRVLNKDLVIQSTFTKNASTVSGARGGFH